MSEKGAIKKSTAQAICDAVKVKEGTTEGVPFKDVAERILALPTASGENKFNQLFAGTLKEVTAEDLKGATLIHNYAFAYCYNLEKVEIPPELQSISPNAFCAMNGKPTSLLNLYYSSVIPKLSGYVYSGRSINLHFPSKSAFDSYIAQFQTSNEIHQNAILNTLFINNEVATELTIPETLTKLSNNMFSFTSKQFDSITFLGDITNINGYPFGYGVTQELVIDFTHCTAVPKVQNSTKVFSQGMTIKAPTALYDEWISTTNWANYAEYVVAG